MRCDECDGRAQVQVNWHEVNGHAIRFDPPVLLCWGCFRGVFGEDALYEAQAAVAAKEERVLAN